MTDSHRALVPNLILQPLVENAIRHGLESRAAPGEVSVVVRRTGHRLVVTVADNGVGESDPARRREGVGLANSRARLQQLYGTDQRFEAGGTVEGFRVVMELPFHLELIDRDLDEVGDSNA